MFKNIHFNTFVLFLCGLWQNILERIDIYLLPPLILETRLKFDKHMPADLRVAFMLSLRV